MNKTWQWSKPSFRNVFTDWQAFICHRTQTSEQLIMGGHTEYRVFSPTRAGYFLRAWQILYISISGKGQARQRTWSLYPRHKVTPEDCFQQIVSRRHKKLRLFFQPSRWNQLSGMGEVQCQRVHSHKVFWTSKPMCLLRRLLQKNKLSPIQCGSRLTLTQQSKARHSFIKSPVKNILLFKIHTQQNLKKRSISMLETQSKFLCNVPAKSLTENT